MHQSWINSFLFPKPKKMLLLVYRQLCCKLSKEKKIKEQLSITCEEDSDEIGLLFSLHGDWGSDACRLPESEMRCVSDEVGLSSTLVDDLLTDAYH